MKTLVAFLTMLFIVTATIAQQNSLNTAIKECKTSKKEVVENLESSSPQELLLKEYEEVTKEVESYLDETLKEFETNTENNSEKFKNRGFKVKADDKTIKSLVEEYLTSHRNDWLETQKQETKEKYTDTITKVILSKYYVPELLSGLEIYSLKWLELEQERYIDFLKTKTVHVKIKEETLMAEMSKEYLKDGLDKRNNIFLYLIEGHAIKKGYGGSINIEHKSKFNFTYISKIENLMEKFASKGESGVKQSELSEIKDKIIKDIKNHISESSKIR